MDISDWSERYEAGNTKWDLGHSPDALLNFISTQPPKQKIIIPGCGSGYEIADLHRLGHSVSAVDFSEGAIRAAKAKIGSLADVIVCSDFFECALPLAYFDLCYERTFLCAIPENLRFRYGSRISSLLREGGHLMGLFHYGVPEDSDPPYPMTKDDRQSILEEFFTLVSDTPCPSNLPVFSSHKERWQVWKKK